MVEEEMEGEIVVFWRQITLFTVRTDTVFYNINSFLFLILILML